MIRCIRFLFLFICLIHDANAMMLKREKKMQSWQTTSYYLSLLAREFSAERVSKFSQFKDKDDLHALCSAKEYYYEYDELKMPEHKGIVANKYLLNSFLLLVDPSKREEMMEDLLYWSANYGYKKSVKYLYKRGANPIYSTRLYTPLEVAVIHDHKLVITLFEKCGFVDKDSLSDFLQQSKKVVCDEDQKGHEGDKKQCMIS